MIRQKLSKIMYHLKRYGFIRTVKKIIARILKIEKKNHKSDQELYQNWITKNEPNDQELRLQKTRKFNYEPKISIVIPMYNTSEKFFLELFNSVFAQTYSNWELCFADRKCSKK